MVFINNLSNGLEKSFNLIRIIIFILSIRTIIYRDIDKIRLGIYTYALKGGGTERATALLLNYLYKEKYFSLYVFSQKPKEENEFKIPDNIRRIFIEEKYSSKQLKIQLKVKRIDILIYQFPHGDEINILNQLENVKIIIYSHFCFLTWIYFYELHFFKILYNSYKNSKYIVSLVPFENDYIFKNWGIKSILMDNLVTFQYDEITPSNLSSKIILMVGRASDRFKRFDLGIQSMKYISKEIKDSEMKIISDLNKAESITSLVENLNLQNKVKFLGYSSKLEEHFHNASLHIFPTVSEAFPMVLCETKVFGIPNILTGLDFVVMSKGGTVIIYDDNPESIARESIKILSNYSYRKNLGEEARYSMKKYKNEITIKKWVNLILSVYKGDEYYNILRQKNKELPSEEARNITKNQVKLINLRDPFLKNITVDILLNFSHMEEILE